MALDVDGRVGKVVQRVAGSAAFATVAPHVVPPLDRLLHRLSGGRIILSRALLPSLVLTVAGRRSGTPREVPLACLPEGDGSFLLVGSNFGREVHPVWTTNLMAASEASVSYGGRAIAVRPQLLDADGKAAVWPALVKMWPTFERYTERSGRDLRVFRLVPEA